MSQLNFDFNYTCKWKLMKKTNFKKCFETLKAEKIKHFLLITLY